LDEKNGIAMTVWDGGSQTIVVQEKGLSGLRIWQKRWKQDSLQS
jgi:hypothetical protein